MVFNFKIYSQESKDFNLEIKIDENNSFFEFHKAIQKILGYESHQLASFFVSDVTWRKQKEISMLDMGLNGVAYFIMQKTKLADLINSKAQKLIYTFDFLNDRSFFIELTGIIMEENLNEPLVTLKQGFAPVQLLDDDIIDNEPVLLLEEEVLMDFGELDDYNEIFGEMDDF